MDKKNKKNFIKKLWSTERGKAVIKLSIYLVFIILVIIFVNVTSSMNKIIKDTKIVEDVTPTIQEMKDDLLKNNYKYTYTITKDTKKTVYSGERLKKEEVGTKENEIETIKYYVNDVTYYQIKMGEKIETNNLYDGFNINMMDSEFILNLIKDKSTLINQKKKLKEYSYEFTHEDKNIEISLLASEDVIKEIDILYDNIKYNLKYSSIGKISELDI